MRPGPDALPSAKPASRRSRLQLQSPKELPNGFPQPDLHLRFRFLLQKPVLLSHGAASCNQALASD